MAHLSVDEFAFDDVRFELLAERLGFADGDHALAKCQRVWRQCQQRGTHSLTPVEIALAMRQPSSRAGEIAGALLAVGLAENAVNGASDHLYLRGTEGRIEWLEASRASQRERSRLGGLARAKQAKRLPDGSFAPARLDQPEPAASSRGPSRSPPDPLPSGIDTCATPLAGSKPRTTRKQVPTGEQAASIQRVLARLSELTGRRYDPTAKEHAGRVLGLLRKGHTEPELLSVVEHKARQWLGDPKMQAYLRPSTLFGPQKFAEYLPEAQGQKPLPWHQLPEVDEDYPLEPGVEDWR